MSLKNPLIFLGLLLESCSVYIFLVRNRAWEDAFQEWPARLQPFARWLFEPKLEPSYSREYSFSTALICFLIGVVLQIIAIFLL